MEIPWEEGARDFGLKTLMKPRQNLWRPQAVSVKNFLSFERKSRSTGAKNHGLSNLLCKNIVSRKRGSLSLVFSQGSFLKSISNVETIKTIGVIVVAAGANTGRQS